MAGGYAVTMAQSDRLAKYRSKRNFRRTGEPSGTYRNLNEDLATE